MATTSNPRSPSDVEQEEDYLGESGTEEQQLQYAEQVYENEDHFQQHEGHQSGYEQEERDQDIAHIQHHVDDEEESRYENVDLKHKHPGNHYYREEHDQGDSSSFYHHQHDYGDEEEAGDNDAQEGKSSGPLLSPPRDYNSGSFTLDAQVGEDGVEFNDNQHGNSVHQQPLSPREHFRDEASYYRGDRGYSGSERPYHSPYSATRGVYTRPQMMRRRPGPPPPTKPIGNPSNVLGVFGLSTVTDERALENLFSTYGTVLKVSLIYDARTQRSRGFGFVYFETQAEAEQALTETNGMTLDGRTIRVDFSVTQRPHSPTPGRYMGPRDDEATRYEGRDQQPSGRYYNQPPRSSHQPPGRLLPPPMLRRDGPVYAHRGSPRGGPSPRGGRPMMSRDYFHGDGRGSSPSNFHPYGEGGRRPGRYVDEVAPPPHGRYPPLPISRAPPGTLPPPPPLQARSRFYANEEHSEGPGFNDNGYDAHPRRYPPHSGRINLSNDGLQNNERGDYFYDTRGINDGGANATLYPPPPSMMSARPGVGTSANGGASMINRQRGDM